MKGKKTSKILVPILMASIAGTIVSGNVRDTRVYAAEAPLLSTEVSMSGFKRTGKVGEEYTLPVVTVDTGYTAVCRGKYCIDILQYTIIIVSF